MIRSTRLFIAIPFLVLAACGESPMAPENAPEASDFIVVMDTTTINLPNTLGGLWQIEVSAVITGNVQLPSERFVFTVDKPSLVQLTSISWIRTEGYSPEAQAKTTTFTESTLIKGLGVGTARITVWHPSNPRLKRIFFMKISQ